MPQDQKPERIALGYVRNPVILGDEGGFDLDFNPNLVPHIPADHPIVKEMDKTFTLSGFERPRTPILVGTVDLSDMPYPTDIHNVPIKFPGTEYRVPRSLEYLSGALTLCASVERVINPNHDEYYAHLSLERSSVATGETQRTAEVHSDGLQGIRVQPKVRTEHMYQTVDGFPTTFFIGAGVMDGLDVDVHDLDSVFVTQTEGMQRMSFEPGQLALFDSYNLHQGGRAPEDTIRAFFRLTYGVRPFNRQGNTVNTLFEDEYVRVGWAYEIRDKNKGILAPPPTVV